VLSENSIASLRERDMATKRKGGSEHSTRLRCRGTKKFAPAGKGSPGRRQLYVNGELVASVDLPCTVPNLFGIIGLSCGYDDADAVVPEDYKAPFAFTGEIKQVVVDLSRELIEDGHQAMRRRYDSGTD
jgi:hypothetical protein